MPARSAVALSIPVLRAIQLSNIGCAIHQKSAVAFTDHIFIVVRRVGRKLANDILEYVLERNNSLNVTIFVDHQRNTLPAPLKLHELRTERRAFRYEVGFVEQLTEYAR